MLSVKYRTLNSHIRKEGGFQNSNLNFSFKKLETKNKIILDQAERNDRNKTIIIESFPSNREKSMNPKAESLKRSIELINL